MSNFHFLAAEWPEVLEPATKAEGLAYSDPRAACFYIRRALELAVAWLYKHDAALRLPYQDSLNALIHEPSFRQSVGSAVFTKAKLIKDLGNYAVHSHKPVRQYDALCSVKEFFHVAYWLAHTYGRGAKPDSGLSFNAEVLTQSVTVPKQTLEQLQRLANDLKERDEKLSVLLADKENLDGELKRLRAEVAAAKKANAERPDTHDYSEAETRDYFIDLLLKEAGWALDQQRDREFPVTGMPNEKGEGFVDYVLWGDDGLPLALVEAKRTRRDARVGQQQAKLYADCLAKQFGRRPVIYYSNGYEHWLWDDATSPPRPVQGFHKKDELELMIQRRDTRRPLGEAPINEAIVERYYQTRAIRRIGEAFEKDGDRKALVVMATGAGKTRTVIALCDLLMRCNWAKRVLFLADRVSLVNQAVDNFKKHLPDSSPVNLVTEKHENGRVFVSTYATMMGLIEKSDDGQRRFGIGHFDIIVIDEAHRSVFQKYRAIFGYFDSLLVGLTATPKDEVDRNTYSLFDLESGVPTDAYTREDAVKDGYLVPPKAVSVPLKFQRDGIKYEDLTEEEKAEWDALEWEEEEGAIPDKVKAEAINKWLFNIDTVDKVLAHLMTQGLKVAGGDRLGKTIIFAKNQAHADFIQERFDINYPNLKGEFARVITFKTEYAQSLIDAFEKVESAPHIAISVDMLDTGIDVPEVVNLVFFKMVRSKTKFWQMVGRGTRLRPNLFGPDKPKECFFIFDYCQNLEFFSENPAVVDGAAGEPLGKRLFKARLELIGELDQKLATLLGETDTPENALRKETAGILQNEVAAMNTGNFVVRPKRLFVERYAAPDAWERLTLEARADLAGHVAGLPSELEPEDEEAKRFDLLLLNLQLALLKAEPSFDRLSKQVQALASALEENANIPMIRSELDLIQNIQTEEWWRYATVQMLDDARKRLRLLIKLIDRQARKTLITDFEDEMGETKSFDLPGFSAPETFEKFRAKARQFLLAHEDHIAVHKLRTNIPLTKTDLRELERILLESGVGTPEDVTKAKEASQGLGLFVRALVGLDREAAKNAMSAFLKGRTPAPNQIQFLDEIVNHLTANGVMDAARLYEAPYTYFHPLGVEGVFKGPEIDELLSVLEEVKSRAIA